MTYYTSVLVTSAALNAKTECAANKIREYINGAPCVRNPTSQNDKQIADRYLEQGDPNVEHTPVKNDVNF